MKIKIGIAVMLTGILIHAAANSTSAATVTELDGKVFRGFAYLPIEFSKNTFWEGYSYLNPYQNTRQPFKMEFRGDVMSKLTHLFGKGSYWEIYVLDNNTTTIKKIYGDLDYVLVKKEGSPDLVKLTLYEGYGSKEKKITAIANVPLENITKIGNITASTGNQTLTVLKDTWLDGLLNFDLYAKSRGPSGEFAKYFEGVSPNLRTEVEKLWNKNSP